MYISAQILHGLVKRQNSNDDGQDGIGGLGSQQTTEENYGSWWWTPAGVATRYAISAIFFGGLLLFLLGGYRHAQRRLAQGKQPLAYHRWMLRTRGYPPPPPPPPPRFPFNHYPPQEERFAMDNYPAPPPAYNPAEAGPPSYQPPQGGSKALADQNFPAGVTNRGGESNAPLPSLPGPAVIAER